MILPDVEILFFREFSESGISAFSFCLLSPSFDLRDLFLGGGSKTLSAIASSSPRFFWAVWAESLIDQRLSIISRIWGDIKNLSDVA